MGSSLLDSARTEGCVDPDHAIREVHLNASAPFKPDALFLSVITSLLSDSIIFKAPVDSGSTHCFVDPQFISTHKLITYSIPLIQLCLFDGSSNHTITQAIYILLQIFPGHFTLFRFYVTPLNSSCSAVLGYNLLWILGFLSSFILHMHVYIVSNYS